MQKKNGLRWGRGLLAVLLFWGCLLTVGCGDRIPDPRAFRETDFAAELQGRFAGGSGEDFSVRIEVRVGENGSEVRLSYLSPRALAGCEISALYSTEGQPVGEVVVRQGELSLVRAAEQLEGLLLPATALLSSRTPERLQRTEGGYRAEYAGDVTLTLNGEGVPLCLSSPEISFRVVWFDRRGVQ